MLGREPTARDIENHFLMMDKDGSGDIDKKEAMEFLVSFKMAIESMKKLNMHSTDMDS